MKIFAAGFAVGILFGGLFVWRFAKQRTETETYSKDSPESLSEAASWVFPREVTIADVFTSPEQLEVLRAPEIVSVYQAKTSGIRIGDYTFEEKGIRLSEDKLKAARNCFHSLNSYTPPKPCGFEPGLQIRFSKSGHNLDIMVCFRCDDIVWRYDDAVPEAVSMMGLSKIGSDVLWTLARETWPDAQSFKVRPNRGM